MATNQKPPKREPGKGEDSFEEVARRIGADESDGALDVVMERLDLNRDNDEPMKPDDK